MRNRNYLTIEQALRFDKLGLYEWCEANQLDTANILDAIDFLREKFEINIGLSMRTTSGLYYGYMQCHNDTLNQKFVTIYDSDIYKMRQACMTESLDWAEKIQQSRIK